MLGVFTVVLCLMACGKSHSTVRINNLQLISLTISYSFLSYLLVVSPPIVKTSCS